MLSKLQNLSCSETGKHVIDTSSVFETSEEMMNTFHEHYVNRSLLLHSLSDVVFMEFGRHADRASCIIFAYHCLCHNQMNKAIACWVH